MSIEYFANVRDREQALDAFDSFRAATFGAILSPPGSHSFVGVYLDRAFAATTRRTIENITGDAEEEWRDSERSSNEAPNLTGRLGFAIGQVKTLVSKVATIYEKERDEKERERLERLADAIGHFQNFLGALNRCGSTDIAKGQDILYGIRRAGTVCGNSHPMKPPMRCAAFHLSMYTALATEGGEESGIPDDVRSAGEAYLQMCERCPFTRD